ncbi:hypothetical protein PYH37_005992 (plasmid) [Sinorhizobium numidicum]|uniref:Uncharacterized protein n=1 Tax=Sinorhizobium numidicum TaxID=680248 RepID=A0ABY8D3G5_9HYPH|nr:hypothetical protein [Sinorhizobium numidicum]WEX79619.1 hypothetical protein PYH37_005992 [Sinorhizobium numidicum]WEX85425.1 hypothetical protein PYH38_006392 [Sinorhizobium numidicum]
MSYWCDPNEFEFEKEIDVDVEFEFESDVDIDFYKDVDVNVDYWVDVNIDGNEATFAIDVEAIGKDTSTELDLVVLVIEDELSSITAVGHSAVA